MFKRRFPDDHRAFLPLPVSHITMRTGGERMAVHIAGTLTGGRIPVICVPGYQRNMTDFSDFVPYFQRVMGEDWPVVLIDLLGRGRSGDRADKSKYISTEDAADIAEVTAALAIDRALLIGQGYGGQVSMALAAHRPRQVAGAVLIDAGPVSSPRSLVRLRTNLTALDNLRGGAGTRTMQRQMLAADYPGAPEGQLDALSLRSHYADKRGRVRTLFDRQLIRQLEGFELDDVLVAQWPLFDALRTAPLMLMRTQLTDQLPRETLEEMCRRRPDAIAINIAGQGSPALLDHGEEVGAIAAFVRHVAGRQRSR